MRPLVCSVAVLVFVLSSVIVVAGSERAQTGEAQPSLKKSVGATDSEPPVRNAFVSALRLIVPGM